MSDRRAFVIGACAACVAGCGGEGGGPEPDPTPAPVVNNGVLEIPLADHPDLQPVGGSIGFANPGGFGAVLIAQTSAGVFEAWSRRCPHQGCSVGYNHGAQALVCPCHGSRFGLDGSLQQGPATMGLTEYPTTFDGTTVFVTLN